MANALKALFLANFSHLKCSFKKIRRCSDGEKFFQMMKEKIDPRGNFQARYLDQPIELNRPGRLAVIEQGMLEYGISPATIKKVMGENLIGFFSRL